MASPRDRKEGDRGHRGAGAVLSEVTGLLPTFGLASRLVVRAWHHSR